MKQVEFYITPEGDVTLREVGKAERQLTEKDTDIIQPLLYALREYYPAAYSCLMEIYSKSVDNKPYRDFLAARRFIKCNFGVFDNTIDIDAEWNFNFEFVSCPMRGECKFDHILCQPKFNSSLSERQLEVMRMCYEGRKDDEIAEALFISINTVANHRKAAFLKVGVHSMGEFNKYANDNKIFG